MKERQQKRVFDAQDRDTAVRLATMAVLAVTGAGTLGLAVRVFLWVSGIGGS